MPGEDAIEIPRDGAADAVELTDTNSVELSPDQRDVTGLEVVDADALGLTFDAPPDLPGEEAPTQRLESSDQIATVRLADLAAAANDRIAGCVQGKDEPSAEPGELAAEPADGSSSGSNDSGVFALTAPEPSAAEPVLEGAPVAGDASTEPAEPTVPDEAEPEAAPGVLSMETELGPEDRAPAAPAPCAGVAEAATPAEPLTPIQVLESILFAAHEPLAPARLGSIVGDVDARSVRRMIEELNAAYRAAGRAFSIEEVAGGYQVFTRPEFNPWLKKLYKARAESKLSQTSLLTLAIVAYKQPIKRVDIEGIRGAACGEVLRGLMDKGLVKIVGREESLGRPLLYGTTKKFLQVFGLGSLKELPKVEELGKP